MTERLSWDQYFMTITRQVAERSTCTRAKVGAVIVREKSILATGYNGAPAGMPHCTEVGCLIYESKTPNGETEQNCFRTIHAEMNAIAQAAKNGSTIKEASIYITHTPCVHCLKVLVNTGIKNIFYEKPYKLHTLDELLRYTQVNLHRVDLPEKTERRSELPRPVNFPKPLDLSLKQDRNDESIKSQRFKQRQCQNQR